MLALSFFLFCLLGHADCGVRDSAETVLSVFGSPHTAQSVLQSTTCPETRARCVRLRRLLTIRELDALAGPEYPEADKVALPSPWPTEYVVGDYEWTEDRWPQELYCLGHQSDWSYPMTMYPEPDAQRHRTRAALIAYVLRTNDWNLARRILWRP
jgi:hypothetical protein